MHRPIKDHLEDFLQGACEREQLREFEAHLEECEDCFQQVQQMREQAHSVRALRTPEVVTPQPGFYGRVMARIESQPRPTVWSLLLDPVFGRRLVYATASLLLIFGTYLVSTESESISASNNGPEMILAAREQAPAAHQKTDTQSQRDAILVNLATYQD
ncbi:MAG: zf-HC2 domain-containing protein [Bryobacterales bacterium]|nr:zf-HC2 domain-containing protein [Bryobacterales bacterium]